MLGSIKEDDDFFNLFIAFEWMRKELAIIIPIDDLKI
jgi:hypothetical protein